MSIRILLGDCRQSLKTLQDESINTCVTSPPYFGLRDYGMDGQIGLEQTPEDFVEELVSVFREVRRVLRDDGTLWLNLGDSYAGSGKGRNGDGQSYATGKQATSKGTTEGVLFKTLTPDCKPKDLIGIPWRVAFALQADGWYLRQDIIWSKPNPMPESVRDRCTKSHEYIFLLSKSAKYHYDGEAIREPITDSTAIRMLQNIEDQKGSDRVPFKTNGTMKASLRKNYDSSMAGGGSGVAGHSGYTRADGTSSLSDKRNKRSVWTVTTKPFSGAHFATYPPDLIEPCILAGCPAGGTVLDPFFGAGTTGLVSDRLGRNCIGLELNPEYAAIAEKRLQNDGGLLTSVTVEKSA